MTQSNLSPVIIVIGFNRPNSLRRLLVSLAEANFKRSNVELVISVDFCESKDGEHVREMAKQFNWSAGEKRLIFHKQNLGLKNHVLSCGDLSEQYGSVIVLEDDLTVGPEFYRFAVAGLEFSANQNNVAGVSLYNHQTNFICTLPFEPVYDGYDNYFLQIASSWGQAWTRDQWWGFRKWYDNSNSLLDSDSSRHPAPTSTLIPTTISNWPESSWLKYFISYLAETDKYFLYPRHAHATNHADFGTHTSSTTRVWQVPLAIRCNEFQFATTEESLAVYDAFFEMKSEKLKQIVPLLSEYDFDVDLYGMKQASNLKRPLVLTSRDSKVSELEFDLIRKPFVANFNQQSLSLAERTFSLTQPENMVGKSRLSLARLRNLEYFHGPVQLRTVAKSLISYLFQKRK